MKSTTFVKRAIKGTTESYIIMRFSYGKFEISNTGKKKYLPFEYSTGYRILNDSKLWKHGLPSKDYLKENKELKHCLTKFENAIDKVYEEFVNQGIYFPTKEELRMKFESELGIKQSTEFNIFNTRLSDFIQTKIDELKQIKKESNDIIISDGRLGHYKNFMDLIIKMENESKSTITFKNIDTNKVADLLSFIGKQKVKKDKDDLFASSTVNRFNKLLRAFIHAAEKLGVTFKIDWTDRRLKLQKEESWAIHLTLEEIREIHNAVIENEKLTKVKDAFVALSLTGLRHSDLKNFNESGEISIGNETLTIKLSPKKTLNQGNSVEIDTVSIPMFTPVKEIFRKYGNTLPAISNQKFNKYIKELFKTIPAFQVLITKKTIRGGKVILQQIPKYEAISSHTGRRSFATNFYDLGLSPVQTLMKITGHKKESTFLAYVRLTKKQHSNTFYNQNNAIVDQIFNKKAPENDQKVSKTGND